MEYKLNTTNYRDFKVIEDNKCAARAYFIPYSKKEKLSAVDIKHERTDSDLVEVLSGEWDFKYYSDISLIPEVLDAQNVEFDKIRVPSTWQRTGYEPPVYLKCPYEFDLPNPNLPEHMSAGIYRKSFEVTNSDDVHILSFLGVVPCIDLYVNGMYVGYSEGAHNSAEFDISEFIYEGTNELLAVVHKWCTGTYLECQDMFRENGIFRDVLLYRLPAVYINDYYIRPRKADGKWTMDVEITLEGKLNGCEVALSLEKDGKVIAGEAVKAERLTYMTFTDLDVTEWNAEVPTVYNAYISLYRNGEELMTLRNLTGFKTVAIKGNTFTFNGQVIKFKGVNHHDTNGKTGYVMTFDDYVGQWKKSPDPLRWCKRGVDLLLYPILRARYLHKLPAEYHEAYACADAVVLLSKNHVRPFMQFGHIDDERKFHVIPNSLSFPTFLPKEKINNKKNVALIVSRLDDPPKRISLAIKIWNAVKQHKEAEDWKLNIVGHGPYMHAYQQLIKKLGTPDVYLLGRQAPNRFYEESSIFMMTSKSEGWGLTVTEAQQMGVVPIAFNSYASLCDIITDGDNGLVIPECDAAQYAEKLLWLMSHVPERRRLAAQAIDSAHRYENSKIVELWHALFKQLKDEK